MTGKIILPCGHEDEKIPHGIPLWVKDQTREGAPAVCYTQYCRACFKRILDDEDWIEDIFFNGYDADEWCYFAFAEWSGEREELDLREAERLEEIAKDLRDKYK